MLYSPVTRSARFAYPGGGQERETLTGTGKAVKRARKLCGNSSHALTIGSLDSAAGVY